MIPEALRSSLESCLSDKAGSPVKIRSASPAGGGCINNAHRLKTTAGGFFVKWNSAGDFGAEAKGLALLRDAGALRVPEVIACGKAGRTAYLLLELIEAGPPRQDFHEDFGAGLALLHRHGATHTGFGLDHGNYIGSLPQSNTMHDTWPAFFAAERLEPQVSLARDSGRIPAETAARFRKLYNKLAGIFPDEPPALLHGDLWSGNYLRGPEGKACLIDPAVYYSHREMDIAMTRLFGGFDSAFYRAYNEALPLEKGWEERADVCNLYPLLVHVNLFGGDYLAQAEYILRRF